MYTSNAFLVRVFYRRSKETENIKNARSVRSRGTFCCCVLTWQIRTTDMVSGKVKKETFNLGHCIENMEVFPIGEFWTLCNSNNKSTCWSWCFLMNSTNVFTKLALLRAPWVVGAVSSNMQRLRKRSVAMAT